MSIFHVSDIVMQICEHLEGKELFLMCQVNNSLHTMIHNMSYPSIIDLKYLSTHNLYHILNTKTLCKINMSNTMITDNFIGNISHCDTLILQHCYNLTDNFIDLIPNCHTLDISYCTNITGAFINKKKYWKQLTMTGCFFLNYEYFGDLECETLDLTRTIIANEFCEQYNRYHPFMTALKKCRTIYLTDTLLHPLNDEFINMLSDKIIYQKITKNFHCIAAKYNTKEVRVPESFQVPGFLTICKNYNGTNTIDTAISNVEQYFIDRKAYIQSIVDSPDKINNISPLDNNSPLMDGYYPTAVRGRFDDEEFDFTAIVPRHSLDDEEFDFTNVMQREKNEQRNIETYEVTNLDRNYNPIHTPYIPIGNYDIPYITADQNKNTKTFDEKIAKLERYHPSIVKEFLNLMTLAHTGLLDKILENGLYFRKQKSFEDDFYKLHKTENARFNVDEAEKYHSYSGFLGPKYLDNFFVVSKDACPGFEKIYSGVQGPSLLVQSHGTFDLFNKNLTSDEYLTIEDKQQLFNIIYLVLAHINTNNVIYSNNCMLPYTDYDSSPHVNEYMNIMETLEKEIFVVIDPQNMLPPTICCSKETEERKNKFANEVADLVNQRNIFDVGLYSSARFSYFADIEDQ